MTDRSAKKVRQITTKQATSAERGVEYVRFTCIRPLTAARIKFPNRKRPFSVLEFHRGRNALLAVLRPHGTVGPMGDYPVHLGEGAFNKWPLEVQDPTFFVVDVRMDTERQFFRVEVATGFSVSEQLMEDVWRFAASSKYNHVYFELNPEVGVSISANVIVGRIAQGDMPGSLAELLQAL